MSCGTSVLNFWRIVKLLSKAGTSYYIPTNNMSGSNFSISLSTLLSVFFILATLVSVKWYLKVLICISLMLLTSLHVFKGHLYILWRNVYIAPLPILKIGWLLVQEITIYIYMNIYIYIYEVKVAQSCLTLQPHTVHGILQARILEWGAVPFSRGSS